MQREKLYIALPTLKGFSVTLMLPVVVNLDFELEHIDVKTAFLHGSLGERILVNQPEGFIKRGDENKVCLLQISMYGLKQSSIKKRENTS